MSESVSNWLRQNFKPTAYKKRLLKKGSLLQLAEFNNQLFIFYLLKNTLLVDNLFWLLIIQLIIHQYHEYGLCVINYYNYKYQGTWVSEGQTTAPIYWSCTEPKATICRSKYSVKRRFSGVPITDYKININGLVVHKPGKNKLVNK